MNWMNGFEHRSFDLPDSLAVARVGGNPNGPALVLLHGFPQTHVMWHRVAHRLALDWPTRVKALCVIDICPTLDMYARTDMDFARAYYHWFHLIQPAPLPENMIGDNRLAYLHHKLGGWGTGGMAHIEPEALAEYERCFCRPEAVHSACEDYRASASIDLEHDRTSRARNDKIVCNTLVLWGERGVVNRMFNPVALWQAQCSGEVTGETLPAGHFIPEELPETTAWALSDYLQGPTRLKT